MQSTEELAGIISDSLDLENSDDLNKIIQRYETMLGANTTNKDLGHLKSPNHPPNPRISSSGKQRLEESWGNQERLCAEIGKLNTPQQQLFGSASDPPIAIEEHYDEDFEKQELEDEERSHKKEIAYNEDDDKLVDEEFNLTSSGGSSNGSK